MDSIPEVVNGNGFLILNGMKGVWLLDELVNLLSLSGVKFKISMGLKQKDFILPTEEINYKNG